LFFRLFILPLILYSCKAQTIYPLGTADIVETNYYVKDLNNDHDAIVGVWRWENGNSYFEITLQEFEMSNYPSFSTEYYDSIFGKYIYVENGLTIAEVQFIEGLPNAKLALHFETPTEYKIVIDDVLSDITKVGEFVITNTNTATFRLWNAEGVKLNESNGQDFALPTDLVLTKQ